VAVLAAQSTELVGTAFVAEALGVTRERVRQLIVGQQLSASRLGAGCSFADVISNAFAALPLGRVRQARRLAGTDRTSHARPLSGRG
jgi:hypothetical protein